ncbi:MAG: iron-containing redox enzyme family protein [Terriglobales bacterium]
MSGSPSSAIEVRSGHAAALRQKVALVRGPSGERFWIRPDLKQIFPEFLFLSHCIIRASVPLMRTAVDLARTRSHEPVSRALVEYFSHHVTEEADHDTWLLDDMESLGLARDQVLQRIPPAEVAELVGAQYYWMHHSDPVALLGYVAVLEGDPPLEEELEAAANRTGLPHDAFRTFISHAKLDPNHKQELDDFIDSLPLSPEQEALISVSAITTMAGLRRVFATLTP